MSQVATPILSGTLAGAFYSIVMPDAVRELVRPVITLETRGEVILFGMLAGAFCGYCSALAWLYRKRGIKTLTREFDLQFTDSSNAWHSTLNTVFSHSGQSEFTNVLFRTYEGSELWVGDYTRIEIGHDVVKRTTRSVAIIKQPFWALPKFWLQYKDQFGHTSLQTSGDEVKFTGTPKFGRLYQLVSEDPERAHELFTRAIREICVDGAPIHLIGFEDTIVLMKFDERSHANDFRLLIERAESFRSEFSRPSS